MVKTMTVTTYNVDEMTFGHCVSTTKGALGRFGERQK